MAIIHKGTVSYYEIDPDVNIPMVGARIKIEASGGRVNLTQETIDGIATVVVGPDQVTYLIQILQESKIGV
jgi:hypothetical protein